MAEFPLTIQERKILIGIIARYTDIWDTPRRLNFLEKCGLDEFMGEVDYQGSPQDFAQGLVRLLQNKGTLIKTGEPALASVLRHLVEDVVAGQENERQFIEQLFGRFSPRIPRVESLPTRTPIFVGHADLIERAITTITEGKVAYLWGMGGIGKTEIALQVAKRLGDSYPDTALIVELQPDNIPADSDAILRQIIRKLNPLATLPETSEEIIALAHQLMATNKRGILILDNAAGYAQFKQWASVWQGWAVIITSRIRFPVPLPLGFEEVTSLSEDESVSLLRALLSHYQRTEDEEDLKRLARECHNLPLALTVAAAFLTTYSDWSLKDYITELNRQPFRMLEAPDYDSVAKVLGFSFTRLLEDQPEIANRWLLLAHMPAPFNKDLVSALLGILHDIEPPSLTPLNEVDTYKTLSELSRRSLLFYENQNQHYRFHDLLQTYALEIAIPQPSGLEIYDAIRSHALGILKEGIKAEKLFDAGEQIAAVKLFSAIWVHLNGAWQNLANSTDKVALYFINELLGRIPHLIDLKLSPPEILSYVEIALRVAKKMNHTEGIAIYLGMLGRLHYDIGRMGDSINFLENALEICRIHGYLKLQATNLGNLGNAYRASGLIEKAISIHKEALEICKKISNILGIASQLGSLGNAHFELGQTDIAKDYYYKALNIEIVTRNRQGEARARGNIANIYYIAGDMVKAEIYQLESLKIAREIGDRHLQILALMSLGKNCLENNRFDLSISYYEEAYDIALNYENTQKQIDCLGHLGNLYTISKLFDKSLEKYTLAINLSITINDKKREFINTSNLAIEYVKQNQQERSIPLYKRAIELSKILKDKSSESKSLGGLGLAFLDLHRWDFAKDALLRAYKIDLEAEKIEEQITELEHVTLCCLNLGQIDEAIIYGQKCLKLHIRIGDLQLIAIAHWNLANLYNSKKDRNNTIKHAQSALELFARIRHPDTEEFRRAIEEWRRQNHKIDP